MGQATWNSSRDDRTKPKGNIRSTKRTKGEEEAGEEEEESGNVGDGARRPVGVGEDESAFPSTKMVHDDGSPSELWTTYKGAASSNFLAFDSSSTPGVR